MSILNSNARPCYSLFGMSCIRNVHEIIASSKSSAPPLKNGVGGIFKIIVAEVCCARSLAVLQRSSYGTANVEHK